MNLNEIMEFGHVIQVHEDGTVTDGPADVWAPMFHNDELSGYFHNGVADVWEQFSAGYTGQDRTSTPMHNSEFIGGRLERDILDTPGVYAAVVCYWDPEDDDDPEAELCDEGWCVARLVNR